MIAPCFADDGSVSIARIAWRWVAKHALPAESFHFATSSEASRVFANQGGGPGVAGCEAVTKRVCASSRWCRSLRSIRVRRAAFDAR